MRTPNKSEFRNLALAGIVTAMFPFALNGLQVPPHSEGVSNALQWNYYDAVLPYQALWILYGIQVFAFIIGTVGFIRFRSWGRWLLLACFVLQIMVRPFTGLYVTSALADALGQVGGALFLVPFVLSFFPPCSGYFDRGPKTIEAMAGDDR